MKKVGEILKAEREKKGLSLHEIGMSLKINAKILKSIEDGTKENLPAKTFLRGFIRSYAQYLKLDQDEILRLFQEEQGESTSTVDRIEQVPVTRLNIERTAPKPLRNDDASLEQLSGPNKWITVVGALILLVLIGSVIKVMNKYQKETQVLSAEEVAHLEPVNDAPEAQDPTVTTLAGGEANTLQLEGTVDAAGTTETTLPASSSTTTLATTTTTLAPTTTTLPATTTTVKATTTTTKPVTTTTKLITTTTAKPTTTTTKPVTTTTVKPTTTTTTKPITTTTASVTTTTVATAVTGKPVETILEATSAVSIRYRMAGREWKTVDLSAGQIHTFKSSGAIEFEISDGGAVNAIVNGVMKGTLGKSGSPTVFTAK